MSSRDLAGRARAWVGGLAAAAVAVSVLPAAAADGGRDWQAALAAVGQQRDAVHAQAYLQQALTALSGQVDDATGRERVASVTAAGATFVDGAHFATVADGRRAYEAEHGLVAWLQSRVATSGGASAGRVDGLVALVRAGRVQADVAVGDAAAVLAAAPATAPGRAAAQRGLEQARAQVAQASEALGRSAPSAAVTHQRNAWDQAQGSLAAVGVTGDSDRDADGVPDRVELGLGASPFSTDSDRDGLTDRFEADALFGFSSPASSDTDQDGEPDPAEDLDGDGLSALREQQAGTDPLEADGDADALDDAAELEAGTDPRKGDTDRDGLRDGAERPAGTDPLKADSDGDGVLDGDEQLRQPVRGEDGITATLVGSGDLAGGFSVTPVTTDARAAGAGGQVGKAYDFSLSPPVAGGLRQAELAMPFPADLQGARPQDLRLFYLDPERGLWRLATDDQRVDEQARTVHASVTHFSTYAIFDIRNWGQTWTAQDNPCRSRADSGTDIVLLDLALVLDSSGSMSWNDPQGLRKTASKSFVDALLPEDRSAVVDFDFGARVVQGLTSDKTAVKQAIDTIDDFGGTNIGAGVSAGNQILLGNGDPSRARMMILLTDGEGSYSSSLTTQARNAGITIYTIGLGTSVDHALLAGIASGTGGTYTNVRTAAELPEVFRRLAEDTGGGADLTKDSDGDGLADCTEISGVLSGFQQRYTSDPTKEDSDGDGLTDAEEVGERRTAGVLDQLFGSLVPDLPEGLALYDVQSDPMRPDTDSDGLSDPAELDLGTSPFATDSDDDELSDQDEVERVGSTPTDRDTDGDDLADGYEDEHRSDQGLDPLHVDVQVSRWSYASDFAKGFILGDLNREDSLAWLAGQLGSDATSFIPVFGWISGAVVAVRDTIGSAIRADWVGSGLSAVGGIPYGGDAVAIPGKAAKFVSRNADKSDEVLSFISKLDDVPTSIKVEASERVLGTVWDVLRREGASEADLLRIQRGRGALDQVAQAVGRATHVVPGSGFLASGRAGERVLENLYGATTKGADHQVWFSTRTFLGRGRYVDVLENGIARESKVGLVAYSRSIRAQIDKDAHLLASGQIQGAHWHFFASGASDSVGADPRVIDLLVQKGIPFTVHLP